MCLNKPSRGFRSIRTSVSDDKSPALTTKELDSTDIAHSFLAFLVYLSGLPYNVNLLKSNKFAWLSLQILPE